MDAIDGSRKAETSQVIPPSLLVIVLDTNPYAWDLLSSTLPLDRALAAIQIFINAHLAFSHDNRVAVLAAHVDKAAWLYPTPKARHGTSQDPQSVGKDAKDKPSLPPPSANKYLPFASVERALYTNLCDLLANTSESTLSTAQKQSNYTTHIAGALTLALSYINKTALSLATSDSSSSSQKPATTSALTDSSSFRNPVNSRILVVSTSGDLAGQYIPLMNLIFGAQHSRVLIDILKLSGDSVLLQQASFTTGGIFINPSAAPPIGGSQSDSKSSKGGDSSNGTSQKNTPPTPHTLLQYLMTAFLPDPHARQSLVPPTSPHVDFRAACFCHQRVVDIGYVCSICLSIFCEDLRKDLGMDGWDGGIECLTCGTALVLGKVGGAAEGGGEKKKKKKKVDGEKEKDNG